MTLSSAVEPLVVYLAHPVGAPTREGVDANLVHARIWLSTLIARCPDVAWCVSWLPYLDVLEDNATNRVRGLRDDCAMVRRCDALVMVGPVKGGSAGMQREAAASSHVLDCTAMGATEVVAAVNAMVAKWGGK